MAGAKKLVKRSHRLAFMNTSPDGMPKYERMTGFTQLTNSKNSQEYSRHYVDKDSSDTDVTGYDPSIAYSFDRHTNTPVHNRIAEIHDNEFTGSDALVDIVVVDLFDSAKSETGEVYMARKRTYAVIPDADGDGTDALIYTGNFKSKSDIIIGTATLDEKQQITTFVENAE